MEAIGESPGRSLGSARARGPAEVPDRQQQAGDAPEGDDREVVPGDGGAAGGDVGVEEGVEVNLLGLTFGIDPFSPALKLPLIGRIGAAR